MKKIHALLLLVFLISLQHAHAGDKKNHWLLVTKSKDTLTASRLDRILDARLFYTGPVSGSILTDSVTGVIHVRYPHYGRNIAIGFTIGSLAGLVVGLIAAPPPDPYNGPLGAIGAAGNILIAVGYGLYGSGIGILVGGGIGTAISIANKKSKNYDLANMSSDEKKLALKKLCAEK